MLDLMVLHHLTMPHWPEAGGLPAQGRLRTIALCESTREDVISSVALWLSPRNVCPVSLQSQHHSQMIANTAAHSQ